MNSEHNHLWGIDLGGTKIEGVVLESADNPTVLLRERIPTEAVGGYDHILHRVGALVDNMAGKMKYRPSKIGIGTPGVLIPQQQVMKNCNTTALNGRPLKRDLENLLQLKLAMANDANCFALAETRLGVVKERFPEAKVVFGAIMGTGVGGGVVVNNQIINGFHGIGGEWGHNYLSESDGYPCYCGKTGCVESMLAGPALERYYAEQTNSVKKLKQIVSLAQSGDDVAAQKTLQRLTHYFAIAISVIINIIDPDVIVIGGGVGNIDVLYTAGVANIDKHIFNDRFEGNVVKPSLGDSAGVFGAAFL